jgi:drug/metabolite transporter (DMT)-like permease
MKDISRTRHGQIYIIGLVATTFLDTWLIYKLPVQTLAILGTIAFPITYFLSSYLYKERITRSMWIGTAFIIGSIIVFLTFA